MVGGVLVERTVKEVVPALVNNRDKVTKCPQFLFPVVITGTLNQPSRWEN